MSNIVPVQFKPEINETLVELLEIALDRAKCGDLVSGKFCGTTASGELFTSYSSTENALLELAAVTRMLHRAQMELDGD